MIERRKAKLDFVQYTDPYCTWCWGSEPFIRKIMETYGGQVSVRYRMGAMFKDTLRYHDGLQETGVERWMRQMADHWVDASNLHGMPVNTKMVTNLGDIKFSTVPPSLAYKAAEIQDKELARKFLRRMREAAVIESKPIHRRVVLIRLAEEVGLDGETLLEAMEDGTAEDAFFKDLREAWSINVKGFPTFHLRNRRGEEVVLRGYRRWGSFQTALDRLGGGNLKPRTLGTDHESILKFVRKYGRVAFREVSVVFDLSPEATSEVLARLKAQRSIKKVKAGNGYFYMAR
jgi:putative protein-disulfide isomerase